MHAVSIFSSCFALVQCYLTYTTQTCTDTNCVIFVLLSIRENKDPNLNVDSS